MGDDIVEFKPGIGPLRVNVIAFWRRLLGKKSIDPVEVMVQRFHQLFQEHGIAITQIPRLVPQLSMATMRNTESLVSALTSDLLDYAANLFGVRRSWLEGVDDRIYETLTCYKQPHVYFEFLATLNMPEEGFSVRALSTTKRLDYRNRRRQPIALVLAEKVKNLGTNEITRYRVFGDAWDWAHPPCRIQLKAMVRLTLHTWRRPIPLHPVSPALLEAIIDGKCVPRSALMGCLLTEPSLEDFALSREESAKAKETGELPDVLDYISSHELEALAQQLTD